MGADYLELDLQMTKDEIHAYSFDTEEQMHKYSPQESNKIDGWFTNRTELTLDYNSTFK